MNQHNISLILSLFFLFISSSVFGINYTWTGTTSTAWNTTTNWSPNGLPDSLDNVTISTATNSPLLSTNRKVNNITISTDSLNLGTFTLTFKGTGTFTSGVIYNGTLQGRSTSYAAFNGTKIDCIADIICGYIRLSGSTFQQDAYFEDTGVATGLGAGGCTFNGNVTIKHTGSSTYFTLANNTGDTFNGNLILINTSTHEINIATSDSSTFNGNIEVNSTNNGGILFGLSGGKSVLASGKTIAVGSTGFTNDYLTLKKFTQLGSTAQALNLTSSGAVNIIDGVFNGGLTVSASGFLLKNNSFLSTSSFTKNGTPNFQSDGGNTFLGATTITNSGSGGRIRMATVTADTYKNSANFNSTGQDVQVAYSGDNYFEGNITINSIKVVFNTATGRVIFTGTNAQSLNGNNNFAFKKVTLNKYSNHVTANTTFSIDDTLTFVKGNFVTTSTNLLTMKATSKAVGASDNSFISGPVKKVGNTAFIFPTGKDSDYREIEISAPSVITNEFTGEFFNDSILVNTDLRDTTLGYVNRLKYWSLTRNSGTSQVYITLSWDSLNALADTFITIASWNGTQWNNLGKGIVNGSKVSGSLKANLVSSSYTQFALSYIGNSSLPTPYNCSSVTTPEALQGCLLHAVGINIITISGDVFFQNSGNTLITFPIPIPSGTTLQSFVGGNSPKWWEDDCPTISTNNSAYFETNNKRFPIRDGALFSMQPGAVIKNLRIRGPHCNYQDYNQGRILSTGIYIENNNTSNEAEISNCEISCFNNAGIWKTDLVAQTQINNCYIHKVKGVSYSGIGYGTWFMGDFDNNPNEIFVNIENSIFDDCKAAIDGQGDPMHWMINNCTFSQFFISEDINKHNSNLFKKFDPNENNPFDYHYCYVSPSASSCTPNCFYGPYMISLQCTTETMPSGSYTTGYTSCNPAPIYDVGGGNTTIQNSIFHKGWKIDQNGNITLPLPNWDDSPNNNRFGDGNYEININQNTFATEKHDAGIMNSQYNNGHGYARIADNYIEACVWDGEQRIINDNNSFSYSVGKVVDVLAPQPFELSIDLKTNGITLSKSQTVSPNATQKYIQYINSGTVINPEFLITNPVSGIDDYFIVRPNPCNRSAIDNNISANNYYFDDQEITSGNTRNVFYNKPGLYGIDILAFDAQNFASTPSEEFKFRTSSWQHIPVIVKDDTEEQVLYFNIKDSYQGSSTINVFKEVRLNDVVIWSESVAEGSSGWEYVRVDLKGIIPNTTSDIIKSLIRTNGDQNILSFNINIGNGVSTEDLAGLYVWVDDVYIKKTNNLSGDNLIKDGSIELGGIQGIGGNINSQNYWFTVGTPTSYSCVIGTSTTTPNARTALNGVERKSGSYAISLNVPRLEDCDTPTSFNAGVVASIGTSIDFTDFLSCDDYMETWAGFTQINATFSSTTLPYVNDNLFMNSNVIVANGFTLELQGSRVVVFPNDPPFTITIEDGGTLKIIPDMTSGNSSHIYACNDMWGGIISDNGNIEIYDQSITGNHPRTIIEDATTALNCDGGKIEVRFVDFISNYNSFKLHTTSNSFNTNSFIRGCDFTTEDNILSKEPFIGHKPFSHIVMENITNFQFPMGGPSGLINRFINAKNGITAKNCSIKIINNTFVNIYDFSEEFPSIRNYGRGIFIRNDNSVNSLTNVIGTLNAGEENHFDNVNTGIHIVNDCVDCNYSIVNNQFDNTNYINQDILKPFSNTAITIQSSLSIQGPLIEVLKNNIINNRIGIHAINIPEIEIGKWNISGFGNTINFNLTQFPLTNFYEGIWIQSCSNAKIVDNIISNTNFNTDVNFRGIDVENSVECDLNCNSITKTGIALNVHDDCTSTKLRRNDFNDYGTGIMLSGNNGASINADQGGPGDAWDNRWYPDVLYSNLKVDGIVLGGFQISWYHQDINDNNPIYIYSPNPWNGNIVDPEPNENSGSVACNDFSRLNVNRISNFGPIVGDSAYYLTDNIETRAQARMQTYVAMKNDTTIIYQFDSLDSTFENFYRNLDSSNVGRFYQLSQIAPIDGDSAAILVSAINPSGEVETMLKSFYNLYINKIIVGDTLNSTDSIDLENMALLSRSTYGQIVHNAAATLFMEVHPQEISQRLAINTLGIHNNLIKIPAVDKIDIFPNPTKDAIFMKASSQMKSIEVFNTYGSSLIKIQCDVSEKQIDLKNLSDGIYYIKTKLQSDVYIVSKLVLQK